MTKDEWFDVYRLFHPDADREEFDRELAAFLKFKARSKNAGTVGSINL